MAAPHGGYDQNTELMAPALADRLGWGTVTAIGYRSVPYRHWFDVNRPSERPWLGDDFGEPQISGRAQGVFLDYRERLFRAGYPGGGPERPLRLLVELHGHGRRVPAAGGGQMDLQVIELATQGFTRDELTALARRYEELAADVPPEYRVQLAVDRLDPVYRYRGQQVRFYFAASEAKADGSLRPEVTGRALHFELPGRARDTAGARRATVELLARLLAELP